MKLEATPGLVYVKTFAYQTEYAWSGLTLKELSICESKLEYEDVKSFFTFSLYPEVHTLQYCTRQTSKANDRAMDERLGQCYKKLEPEVVRGITAEMLESARIIQVMLNYEKNYRLFPLTPTYESFLMLEDAFGPVAEYTDGVI